MRVRVYVCCRLDLIRINGGFLMFLLSIKLQRLLAAFCWFDIYRQCKKGRGGGQEKEEKNELPLRGSRNRTRKGNEVTIYF